MVVLFILLTVITALILWIALTPLHVTVNTDLGQYWISQAGTVKIAFHPWQRPPMRMWLFGFRINAVSKKRMVPPTTGRQKKKAAIKRSLSSWLYLFQGIYNSFRLKKFVCTIDLDNPVMNARLIPFILLLNRGVVSLNTNFVNRNFLYLKVHVSFSRILWTTFRFYTKK
ncbi:MAG TPA: hypothetical protein VIQ51_16465 [Chryseosolibacter sp.]|jgi:hypothetical protein